MKHKQASGKREYNSIKANDFFVEWTIAMNDKNSNVHIEAEHL